MTISKGFIIGTLLALFIIGCYEVGNLIFGEPCKHEQENTTLRHTLTTTQDSLRRTRDSLDRQNAALDTILSRKNDQRLRGLLNAVMAANEWSKNDSIKHTIK